MAEKAETLTVDREGFSQFTLDRIQEALEEEERSAVGRLDTITNIVNETQELQQK